ncbi:hypothetical protein Micbo1qcDRAFT_164021 [Microdochium bolleyi]|uniref:Uncharacterized protein n=1 Tax=Microdochium bolleyi TaxID=196109 RepID=A0A136IZP5_9PEZI|nr:hypothetical protein Micbo1qcDRAFT_164021 [Microdochium bolleyi]
MHDLVRHACSDLFTRRTGGLSFPSDQRGIAACCTRHVLLSVSTNSQVGATKLGHSQAPASHHSHSNLSDTYYAATPPQAVPVSRTPAPMRELGYIPERHERFGRRRGVVTGLTGGSGGDGRGGLGAVRKGEAGQKRLASDLELQVRRRGAAAAARGRAKRVFMI